MGPLAQGSCERMAHIACKGDAPEAKGDERKADDVEQLDLVAALAPVPAPPAGACFRGLAPVPFLTAARPLSQNRHA